MYNLRFFMYGEELCIAECESNHYPLNNEEVYLTDQIVFDKKDIGTYKVVRAITVFDKHSTSVEIALVKDLE